MLNNNSHTKVTSIDVLAARYNECFKHVLLELERLNGNYEGLRKSIENVRIDVAQLKVKAGAWGLIGGAIPAGVAILFILLRGN